MLKRIAFLMFVTMLSVVLAYSAELPGGNSTPIDGSELGNERPKGCLRD